MSDESHWPTMDGFRQGRAGLARKPGAPRDWVAGWIAGNSAWRRAVLAADPKAPRRHRAAIRTERWLHASLAVPGQPPRKDRIARDRASAGGGRE
jgi:hypothetical protein